ncbi:MAG: adenylate/guanylate cyclase domain-containing response regulator [Spirochaetes bacterium]|nr:adenylate/guanylate cyclase domain-containing response regulator [Spirochaetota bacterium]
MPRILIVEDEAVQSAALEAFVSAWGYEIVTQATATGSIGYLSTNKIDLALIDLHLPDNPGIEILKHIRDVDDSIPVPVFMMSAEDSPEIRIVCMSTGADDFLAKPLNFADVSMKIQQAFERVSYKRQIQELNAKLEKDKKSLQRYFSSDLVEKILNEELSTELGGTIVEASLMFFDIRGSTTMAEKIGPQAYAERISKLFADLMDIIFENGGSINELLGDGILATFGCPFPKENDAMNAIAAALAIERHMRSINNMREIIGKVPWGFGMGIATGRIFAGNIGSERMIKYAVMGDAVNTAARIQDLTKDSTYKIIVDEPTYSRAAVDCKAQDLGETTLRGKQESVRVFGLIG